MTYLNSLLFVSRSAGTELGAELTCCGVSCLPWSKFGGFFVCDALSDADCLKCLSGLRLRRWDWKPYCRESVDRWWVHVTITAPTSDSNSACKAASDSNNACKQSVAAGFCALIHVKRDPCGVCPLMCLKPGVINTSPQERIYVSHVNTQAFVWTNGR